MAYFDNAATTFPKPECVYRAMEEFQRQFQGSFGRSIEGGKYSISQMVSDTRQQLKNLLQCNDKVVIFTPTATIALNIIIQGLIKVGKTQVYITPFEHNAVTRILQYYDKLDLISIHVLPVSSDSIYDLESIRYQFEASPPDLVIMSHASNVTGLITPVEAISSLAKSFQAITVIDMAQSAGLVDLNVGNQDLDFAIFAGHKTLYGPQGISGFVMKESIRLEPILFGGTGFDSANQDMPEDLPQRFEAGTMNAYAIAGLNASLKWIKETGIAKLYDKEVETRRKLLDVISQYEWAHVIGNNNQGQYVGIISMVIDSISSDSAGQIFAKRGISVRTGLQCSPMAHKHLGTFPAGTIRLSPSFFTGKNDIEELIQTFEYIDENL